MGSGGISTINGVIYNDSPHIIQYQIYGRFEEQGNLSQQIQINPQVSLSGGVPSIGGEVSVSGAKFDQKQTFIRKYESAVVQVYPGRSSTMGLTQLKANQNKITIRCRETNQVPIKGVIIKSQADIMLKIREDGSVKNLGRTQGIQRISYQLNPHLKNELLHEQQKPNKYTAQIKSTKQIYVKDKKFADQTSEKNVQTARKGDSRMEKQEINETQR